MLSESPDEQITTNPIREEEISPGLAAQTAPPERPKTVINAYKDVAHNAIRELKTVFSPGEQQARRPRTLDDSIKTLGGNVAINGVVGAGLVVFSAGEFIVGNAGRAVGALAGNQGITDRSKALVDQSIRGGKASVNLLGSGVVSTVEGAVTAAALALITPYALYRTAQRKPVGNTPEEQAAADAQRLEAENAREARTQALQNQLYFVKETIRNTPLFSRTDQNQRFTLLTSEQVANRTYQQMGGTLCCCDDTPENRVALGNPNAGLRYTALHGSEKDEAISAVRQLVEQKAKAVRTIQNTSDTTHSTPRSHLLKAQAVPAPQGALQKGATRY